MRKEYLKALLMSFVSEIRKEGFLVSRDHVVKVEDRLEALLWSYKYFSESNRGSQTAR